MGSSIPRATHTGSYIHVGPEIGVASTKAFTGQVTVLTMLALALAREKHTVDEEQYLAIVRELGQIPEKMKEVLKLNDSIAEPFLKSSPMHATLSIWDAVTAIP